MLIGLVISRQWRVYCQQLEQSIIPLFQFSFLFLVCEEIEDIPQLVTVGCKELGVAATGTC